MLSNYRPLSRLDGNDDWRPSTPSPELTAQLAADRAMENAGGDADDRVTCATHQAWFEDCVGDPSHANPITKFNWCAGHNDPVQLCGCRPPTTEG